MKSISIDNGYHWVEPAVAIEVVGWDAIVNIMEDDLREQVHAELAPCTELEFLTRYLELVSYDLVIG